VTPASPGRDLSRVKAALLERWRQGQPIHSSEEAITPRASTSGPVPLSLAQQRLWFVERLSPGTAAYNLSYCGVTACLDPDVLRRTIHALVLRHEALRTTFTDRDGVPCQLVDAGRRPELEVVDLTRASSGQGSVERALETVDAAVHEPFDLERGPLARVLLCRTGDRDVIGFVVHHLVADGWSLGVALRDLAALYEAHSTGRQPVLPPLGIGYADYAVWQQETARARSWEPDLEYWRRHLADAPVLELPTDRPRPPILGVSGDWRELRLTATESEALRALGRTTGATPFMVLLAAFHVVLSKLSGQDDLVVGTATANRTHPETHDVIGNFANTLALRTHLGGDPTFVDVVARVRETCLRGFAHEGVPFERVVQAVQPRRDLSRSVLFQALFVQQPPTPVVHLGGAPIEPLELGSRAVRADLELHVWDRPEIVGRLAFSTELFEAVTAERMLGRFRQTLSEAVANPSRRISALPITLADERRLLRRWTTGSSRRIPQVGVHELVAEHARQTPDAPAVISNGRSLTYAELDRRANGLAHALAELGVGPEARVAVGMQRSASLVCALLGILKAGGAYVPLDPSYPASRLELMSADSGACAMVTEPTRPERTWPTTAPLVYVDGTDSIDGVGDEQAPAREPPRVALRPGNLAYVIYTSGSTGVPKGVGVTHRALANLVSVLRTRLGIGPGDVVPMLASPSFDASVAELFPVLASGATLLLPTMEELCDGSLLRRRLLDHGVTLVQATATTWRLLQSAGGLPDRRIVALVGGEATPLKLAHALARQHHRAWHMYGPTEATVWSTMAGIQPGHPLSLGRPLPNVDLHVVNDDLDEVPVGVVGEICIGGVAVGRGYLGRPALTGERFVPDPFGAAGSRMYRTGDLARFRHDGSLEFLGRRDQQVKLRGHRIELGDVEAALADHPMVEQVAVTLQAGPDTDPRLVAYVVRKRGRHADHDDLTLANHVRRKVPQYMVPSALVFCDTLPTTPSGKIDRRALPSPAPNDGIPIARYVPPRTSVEADIADRTARVLHLERVGVADDFFLLGGHSLLAAALLADLRNRYRVEIPIHELFLVPTVEHLAKLIEHEMGRRKLALGAEEGRVLRIVTDLDEAVVDDALSDLLPADGSRRNPGDT
jgi:amino acid adenylation domain-containing protein